jgi:hypothetical protein
VTATDPAGNVSESTQLPLTVDTTAPATAVITGPAAGSLTNDSTPAVTGTTDPNTAVTVTDGHGHSVCTATSDAQGAWSCVPNSPLPQGDSQLTATATDQAGNSTVSAPVTVTVDTLPPAAPAVVAPAPGELTPDGQPALSGTGDPGDTITVTEGGTPLCTATVDANGQWSCRPELVLADGDHTFTVTATDPAGNTSGATKVTVTVDTTAPGAPVVTGPAGGGLTQLGQPDVTGTGVPGDTITVTEGGTPLCTATVDANGQWSCRPELVLVDGDHVFTVSATDPAGNTSISTEVVFTVDTTAPNAPVVTAPVEDGVTNNPKPEVAGTGEPGDTIVVSIDGQSVCTVTVSDNGTWRCAVTSPLAEGPHTVVTQATDPAGNQSDPAEATFTVDRTAPGAPVLNATDGSHLTGQAEPGATVTVTGVDGPITGCESVVADAAGKYECTPVVPLPKGAVVQATATDRAGNRSAETTVVVGARDAFVEFPSVHTGQSNGLTVGNWVPGETVTVEITADGRTIQLGEFTVGEDGAFTMPFDLPADFPIGTATVTMTGSASGVFTTTFQVAPEVAIPTGGSVGGRTAGSAGWLAGLVLTGCGLAVASRVRRSGR